MKKIIPLRQNTPLLQQAVALTEQTEHTNTSMFFSRFGHIVSLGNAVDTVIVDFEGNPFGQPQPAKLGRAFRKNEIEMAMSNRLVCRIDFINHEAHLPIVSDIFFSLLTDNHPLILRADHIIIDAAKELIIRSGTTQTRYSGRDERITTSAKYVTSQAEKSQKIQGGTISIN